MQSCLYTPTSGGGKRSISGPQKPISATEIFTFNIYFRRTAESRNSWHFGLLSPPCKLRWPRGETGNKSRIRLSATAAALQVNVWRTTNLLNSENHENAFISCWFRNSSSSAPEVDWSCAAAAAGLQQHCCSSAASAASAAKPPRGFSGSVCCPT